MNIALCDDDECFLNFLDRKLRNYLNTKELPFNIKQYRSGEELIRCKTINQINLVFLDIRMAKLDGIQVAQILRQRNPDFILIFVSSYIEYAPLGYEVKALRYILKEQMDMLFDDMMDTILKEMGYGRTKITLDFSLFGTESFYTDSLIYSESKLHVVYFYLGEKTRHLYDTLDSIEKILPAEEFIRIHKSYLVNIKYLVDIKNYTAFLGNGVQLPISQKKFPMVKKRLFLYKGSDYEYNIKYNNNFI